MQSPPIWHAPRSLAPRRPSPTGWAVVCLAALGVLIVMGPGRSRHAEPVRVDIATATSAEAPANPVLRSHGAWMPSESTWGEQLRQSNFWSNRKNTGAGWNQPNGLTSAAPTYPRSDRVSVPYGVRGDGTESDGKTYRTMCVRLCDGFYWPVSYATTKDKFSNDAATCSRTCGGADEAKLFTYRNPGGEIDDMEDLDGRAYKKLQTAFLFRTKYDAQCKCRPHPWEEASTDRHKTYALAAQANKGNQQAAQQLKELRTKIQSAAQTPGKSKSTQRKTGTTAAALAPTAGAPAQDATSASDKRDVRASGPRTRQTLTEGGTRSQRGDLQPGDGGDATAVDKRPASPGTVILRFGSRAPVEVQVPVSTRARQAVATDSNVVKR